MIDAELQARDIERLNAMFGIYATLNKRDLDLLLHNRANQLGYSLYLGYRGRRPRGKGYAHTEFRRRIRRGKGIRPRGYKVGTRDYVNLLDPKWADRIPEKTKAGRRTTLWQRLVGQELARRTRGRGFLAASFLMYRSRRRFSQSKGTYVDLKGAKYVRNKTGAILGRVDPGPGQIRLRAFPEGLALIDAKYSIVRKAFDYSERDMVKYITPRMTETAREAIQKAGLTAYFA